MKPKTQHQQVIYYLVNWEGFTLSTIIKDSLFYKFQTRLSELEKEYGKLATRKQLKFTNKFGNKGKHYWYKAIDKNKCIEIFNKLNKK